MKVCRNLRDWSCLRLTFILVSMLTLGLATGCKRKAPARSEATLEDLNRALQVWSMTKPNPPQDVTDLTNSMGVRGKRLPQPPPGKKLAIDPVQHRVVWVDQ
jgi:hypothetical protein